jgi:hypothetical protein
MHRRQQRLLEAGGRELVEASRLSACSEFHGGALLATTIGYVVTLALVLYSWTYANPAAMQSDVFVSTM